jgi:hypothetical protein
MPPGICNCGRTIEQAPKGRPRLKCKVCRPPEKKKPRPTVVAMPVPAATEPHALGRIAASTLSDLQLVDRHETTAGITALHLADLLDGGGYNAQGAASLVKAHREALALALEGTAASADVIDLIFGAG